ncbi:MAG: PAS domain S-box protein, partial [Halobacteriaceae archaeon]
EDGTGPLGINEGDSFYQSLVENAREGVVTIATDGRVINSNSAIEDILGYKPDDLVGKSLTKIIPDRLVDDHRRAFEAYLRSGDTTVDWDGIELSAVHQEGHEVAVEISFHDHIHDGDRVFTGFISDITERKEQRKELERHEAYLEHSHDIVTVVDADGRVKFQSDSTEQITGYSPQTIEGEVGFDHIHPEDREKITNLFGSVVDQPDEVASAELRVETAEDSWRWIEARGINKLHDEQISGIVVSSRDITDRKKQERELERQNERLKNFASVLSHDLRNPLNVARGRLELASDEYDSEHLNAIERALDRMESLITGLLTLAREGKAVTDHEPVDLSTVLEACWTNVDTENATIEIEIDRTIQADESRLQQVFENLFRNAVDHGGDEIIVTVGEIDDGFYVEDDGQGIPEADRKDVFEASYSTSEGGTGLGLSIVKEIVAAHDWEIHVTESSDGGARFEITGVEIAAE